MNENHLRQYSDLVKRQIMVRETTQEHDTRTATGGTDFRVPVQKVSEGDVEPGRTNEKTVYDAHGVLTWSQ